MDEFLYNLNGKSYYYKKHKQQTNTISKVKRPIGKKKYLQIRSQKAQISNI